jgi:hypothetical protein
MEKTPESPSGVSYIMPIYNEVDYVEAAVSSILAQEYGGPVELVLALAPSTDASVSVVRRTTPGTPSPAPRSRRTSASCGPPRSAASVASMSPCDAARTGR